MEPVIPPEDPMPPDDVWPEDPDMEDWPPWTIPSAWPDGACPVEIEQAAATRSTETQQRKMTKRRNALTLARPDTSSSLSQGHDGHPMSARASLPGNLTAPARSRARAWALLLSSAMPTATATRPPETMSASSWPDTPAQ